MIFKALVEFIYHYRVGRECVFGAMELPCLCKVYVCEMLGKLTLWVSFTKNSRN